MPWGRIKRGADVLDNWLDPEGPPTKADLTPARNKRKYAEAFNDWDRLVANTEWFSEQTRPKLFRRSKQLAARSAHKHTMPKWTAPGSYRLRRFTARAMSARRSRYARSRRSTGPMRSRMGVGYRRYSFSRRRRMPYYKKRIMRRKRSFTRRVKKVMGSQVETKYLRLDSADDTTDPRVCLEQKMANGLGMNVRLTRQADPLFPAFAGNTGNQVVGEEYYSMGYRINIRVHRNLSDSGNGSNYVVGYMVYSLKKDQQLPQETAKNTFNFFPANGKTNTLALSGASLNNTRARNEPTALFHRYTTLSSLANDNVGSGEYSVVAGPPRRTTGWPKGVNPWTDGALHERINVKRKGIIMQPVDRVTATGATPRVGSAYKSLWIKTGRKIDDQFFSQADTYRNFLRNTYLAIWCYNPNLKIAADDDVPTITVEYTHYYKDP